MRTRSPRLSIRFSSASFFGWHFVSSFFDAGWSVLWTSIDVWLSCCCSCLSCLSSCSTSISPWSCTAENEEPIDECCDWVCIATHTFTCQKIVNPKPTKEIERWDGTPSNQTMSSTSSGSQYVQVLAIAANPLEYKPTTKMIYGIPLVNMQFLYWVYGGWAPPGFQRGDRLGFVHFAPLFFDAINFQRDVRGNEPWAMRHAAGMLLVLVLIPCASLLLKMWLPAGCDFNAHLSARDTLEHWKRACSFEIFLRPSRPSHGADNAIRHLCTVVFWNDNLTKSFSIHSSLARTFSCLPKLMKGDEVLSSMIFHAATFETDRYLNGIVNQGWLQLVQ